MFVAQRPKLPIVEAFTAAGFQLSDMRTIRGAGYSNSDLAPLRASCEKLEAYVAEQRPEALICGTDTSVRDDYEAAFAEFRKDFPQATTTSFDNEYKPDYDDSAVDPRLSTLTFAVAEGGVFVGVLHLYNIRVQRESPREKVISAYPSPSFETKRGYLHPDDLGGILKHILEYNLHFVGSPQVLDLAEWRFPTRKAHAWIDRAEGGVANASLAKMSAHSRDDVALGNETIPRRIRRRP